MPIILHTSLISRALYNKAHSCVNTACDHLCVVYYAIFCLYSTLMSLTWIFKGILNFQLNRTNQFDLSSIKFGNRTHQKVVFRLGSIAERNHNQSNDRCSIEILFDYVRLLSRDNQ